MATLENYHRLLARVDELCRTIEQSLGEAITCHAGCSSCCLSISVFPVEMAAMIEAAGRLPADDLRRLKEKLTAWSGGDVCPLLSADRCLLYEARPIICRTHGLPVLFTDAMGDGSMSAAELPGRWRSCPVKLYGSGTAQYSAGVGEYPVFTGVRAEAAGTDPPGGAGGDVAVNKPCYK